LPKLIGIPASPGIAIGKVHPIDRRRARVPRFHIAPDQVAAEITRLEHAVRDSVEQLRAIRDAGGAVLLISEELDELLALSDRLVVLSEGRIVGALAHADFGDRVQIGRLIAGAETA